MLATHPDFLKVKGQNGNIFCGLLKFQFFFFFWGGGGGMLIFLIFFS